MTLTTVDPTFLHRGTVGGNGTTSIARPRSFMTDQWYMRQNPTALPAESSRLDRDEDSHVQHPVSQSIAAASKNSRLGRRHGSKSQQDRGCLNEYRNSYVLIPSPSHAHRSHLLRSMPIEYVRSYIVEC